MQKTALITGYTGQDGTFLTKHLLDQGYKVVGMIRRISTEPPIRVRGLFDFSDAIKRGDLVLEPGDLLSRASLDAIIDIHQPDEIYNLAAMSHVGTSFSIPEFTIETTFLGVVNLINALEAAHKGEWRLYQASTSEMFGDYYQEDDMYEETPFRPNSPYAIAKAAAHFYCRMKRDQGRFISCGILFNHESEIRGGDFVTQKIIRETVRWLTSSEDRPEPMELGNINAKRDWGYAGDYVKAMHLMLQADKPDDFTVATGKPRTVREFVEAAAGYFDKTVTWNGEGHDEIGSIDGREFVRINPKYYRPNDVNYLSGDSSKARNVLGWEPSIDFDIMVGLMVKHEIDRKRQQ